MIKYKAILSALVLLIVAANVGCPRKEAPPVEPPPMAEWNIEAEVVADPLPAVILFKGEELGAAPVSLKMTDFGELLQLAAQKEGLQVIETRFRFVNNRQAQVVFRFGTEPSPVAKALGLTRVLVFDYSDNATFDTDEYDLKPDLLPLLEQQAELLNRYFQTVDIYICGHTDSTGGNEHNLELSLKRAQSVTNFLASQAVARERLHTHGFGKDYPLASNSDLGGRAMNRRTEIVLPQ